MPPGVHRLFSHGHMEAAADPAVSSALRASGMGGKEAASYESRLLLFIRKLIKKDSSSSKADFAHLCFPSQLRENLGKPTSECPPSALDPTSPTMPLMLSSRLRPGLLRAAVSVIGSNKLQSTDITRRQDFCPFETRGNAARNVVPWPPAPPVSSGVVGRFEGPAEPGRHGAPTDVSLSWVRARPPPPYSLRLCVWWGRRGEHEWWPRGRPAQAVFSVH